MKKNILAKIDTKSYNTKPTGCEIGSIRNRLGRIAATETRFQDFVTAVELGKSYQSSQSTGKTNKFEMAFNGTNYKLKDQSANDLTKYGHIKDISRIEYFKETEDKFLVGYAITITNQSRTWQKISNPHQTDYEFSLEDGSKLCRGIKKWQKCVSNHNENRNPPVTLKNDYDVHWRDFYDFNKPHGMFKVLVTEVK